MSHLLQLLLLLVIILACAKWAGSVSLRYGQPAVFGKILVGLILGPTMLNLLGAPIFLDPAMLDTMESVHELVSPVWPTIKDMAEIGVILLMFLAGLETDFERMKKVGKTAFWAAVGGVLGPFFFGIGAAWLFMKLGIGFTPYEVIFIGTILTATSVSISAQVLMEIKMIRSKEGVTILGAAVIDDVLGIILLSFVIAFKPAAGGGIEAAKTHLLDHLMGLLTRFPWVEANAGGVRITLLILLMLVFGAIAWFGFKFALRYIQYMGQQPIAAGLLASAIVIGLFYAWMAEFVGNLAAITGSYLAGVLIAQTHLRENIEHQLHTLTYGMFVSIFFISIGLEANARTLFAPLAHLTRMTREEWLIIAFSLLIVVIAVFTKVWGCQLGARFSGFSREEAFRVGVGMVSRGEVGLIVAAVGLSAGIIDVPVFSMMILMVLVTTLVTPIWLKSVMAHAKPHHDAHGDGGAEAGATLP
jgi:Kef-type K+ transport system membrane component KefB